MHGRVCGPYVVIRYNVGQQEWHWTQLKLTVKVGMNLQSVLGLGSPGTEDPALTTGQWARNHDRSSVY